MDENEIVKSVRAAIADRALYLALLYLSFLKVLPKDEVEHLARQAIYEFGIFKGKADQNSMTPQKWVEHHVSCGGAAIFDSNVKQGKDTSEQIMTYCPLMDGWRELGCSDEEMDLLCDIAMEVDRGRADYHKIPYEIKERIAKGDSFCRLVLKDKAYGKIYEQRRHNNSKSACSH